MAIKKPYTVEDKCANCIHSILEHDMWICLHHKIDLEEYDTEMCEDYKEGFTPSSTDKLERVQNELVDVLKYSKIFDKNFFIESTFMFDSINNLIKSDNFKGVKK